MSSVKISELPAATTPLSGAELVPLTQASVTKQATVTQIATYTSNNISLPISNISATGTPSASNFLRGDSSWSNTIYSGSANATTYNTMIAAGGGSTATIQNQGTTSVSTSATTILTAGQYGSFCLVFGSDGTNRFMDVVLFGLGTGTVNVISSLSVAGSPSARTYTQSSSAYKLAMASGTYTVQVVAFTMSG